MLNNIVLRVFLSLSLAFSFVGAANATLINQDILFNSYYDDEDTFEVIGHVSINLATMDEWGWVEGTWESFSFYGYEVDSFDIDWNLFVAVIDVSNIMAGIESLDFDVTLFSDLSFAGYIDVYDQTNSISFSLFNNANADLGDAGTLAFGKASVVPEPYALLLFLTGLMGLIVRRKNS